MCEELGEEVSGNVGEQKRVNELGKLKIKVSKNERIKRASRKRMC